MCSPGFNSPSAHEKDFSTSDHRRSLTISVCTPKVKTADSVCGKCGAKIFADSPQNGTATDENRLTSAQLTALGITESSVSEKLLGSYKGWLCEEQGSVVGFAIGDRSSGEMWVIAVLPTHIRRGIGAPCWSRLKPGFSAKVVRRCGLRRTLTLGCEHLILQRARLARLED